MFSSVRQVFPERLGLGLASGMAPKKRGGDVELALSTPVKRHGKRKAETPSAAGTPSTPGASGGSSTPSSSDTRPGIELLEDPKKTWVAPVLSTLAHIFENGFTLHSWLLNKINSMGIDTWVEKLDVAFPHVAGLNYLKESDATTPGSKLLRLWMLGIHPDTGNSGLMVMEDVETLVQLVCVFGFRTDADTMMGVEKLASKSADTQFVEACKSIAPYARKPSLAPVGSVWHVKGWKRSVTALFVATIVAEVEGLGEQMLSAAPAVHQSFCTVHSVFEKLDDPVGAIWASRSITMSSTSTRRAPNCFNNVHQLRKMDVLAGAGATDTTDWNRRMGIMRAFNIGPQEATAAMNLSRNVPKNFADKLQRMVEKWGFRVGPLTHAVLSLDIICLGKGPLLPSKKWSEDLRNDEYTLDIFAKRIEIDWESTPKSLRKPFTPTWVIQKQLICATFNKMRNTLKAQLPDAVFQIEFPLLEHKFFEQYLDSDLEQAAQNQLDPWPMHEITDVVSIVKRLEASICAKDRERHREVMMRAEAATLDQLMTELQMDQDDAERYLAKKTEMGQVWEKQVANHKTKRYNKGLEMARTFLDNRFSIVDLPDAKHIAREVSLMRRKLEAENISSSGSTRLATLIFLDLNVDHGSASMSALKPIADILQQSEQNCLVLMYPQAHANFKLPQKLKVERTCEDKLLTLGLNMEADASLHFNIAEEHASDKRRLEARLRVVVSNDFQDSPWLQSRAARGNLGEAPLIKVKDMMGPASRIKSQPGGYRLNPGDRVTQRGIGAMSHLLRNLMSGLNFQAGDKLLFVQVNVGEFAEMPHAVLNMMLESQATPYVCLKGIYINKAGEMDASAPGLACYPSDGGRVLLSSHIPVNQLFAKRLMEEWWDRQPEAGPKDLPASERGGLDVPNLRVCVWQNDVPTIADSLRNKFPEASDASAKWQAVLKAHTERFGQSQATQCLTSHVVVSTSQRRQVGSGGPDFSVDPKPRNLNDEVSLESADDLPEFVAVAEGRRPGQPDVKLDKDGHMWICVNQSDADTVNLQACELLGFGKGEFKTMAPTELETWNKGIPFMFKSDVDLIVLVNKDTGNKNLMEIASAVCRTEVEDGIPNVDLQNHIMSPMQRRDENLFHRYTILHKSADGDAGWGFAPDGVPAAGDGQVIKCRHTELGAHFFGKSEAPVLPSIHAGLVWELELDKIPPPSLNVLKPKFWLLKKVSLEKGIHYKLR